MTTIIFILIAIAIFFTRKIWGKHIVELFSKKRAEKTLVVSDPQAGSVFSPRGTVRTFVIAIDIQELGDGTAKISLAKLKEKEV